MQGPASVPVVVTDSNNGTYEASFLLVTPGVYSAEIYLDYTLCDGYKDPPVGWFVKGENTRAFIDKKGVKLKFSLAEQIALMKHGLSYIANKSRHR